MFHLIETIALHKKFTSGKNIIIAVEDVSLTFDKGTSTAITGPSGCGKTTLINMIGLLVPPSSGELLINSTSFSTINSRERTKYRNQFFGYIVQNFALVDHYNVYENVEIPLLYANPALNKKERRNRVQSVLQKVGILEKVKEKVSTLSGGQKQRVAIARALVNNPEVILADEPTGSLDTETSKEIFLLLKSLVEEGKTLIMVTHNPELAQGCEREIKMIDGNLLI
ncbi:ABC transporter ATP-binding protein [Saccharibacillus deserti]|uniref:ABC transporter ATP-binding protein n=1 Tax=Saccharibacillus deserti TaxID=1634444 RepID=UPI00155391DF|nr:ABC transporter ATP-binding protein [Saccharibacillus deserti]